MNVLMISLGDSILRKPIGDEITRHLEYTAVSGDRIFMFVYSKSKAGLEPKSHEDRFFIYPSLSAYFFCYPYDVYKAVLKLAKKVKFDIIYTQDPFGTALAGGWISRKLKIPYIIGSHSNFIDNKSWISERPIFFRILNRLAKYNLPRADAWRVLNQDEKGIYQSRLKIPSESIHVLNTPVNLDRFLRPADKDECSRLRHKLGIKAEAPVLIWVGRPVKVKRIPVLLKSFKQVLEKYPTARLIMIGNKKFVQEDLESEIRKLYLADNVIWVRDGVKHEELPKYYRICDIYVHTSNYEGFGKVLVEAAASGLPIVATDIPGPRRIVQEGETGFLVPVDDDRAIADGVFLLLKDPEQAQRMGDAGRQYVEQCFSREQNIKSIVNMWHKVAAGNNGRK